MNKVTEFHVTYKGSVLKTFGHFLVYLVGPMRKKYSTTFFGGHPFNICVSYD